MEEHVLYEKKVPGLVPLLYTYLIDNKFETFFFNFDLILRTINGILRYFLIFYTKFHI